MENAVILFMTFAFIVWATTNIELWLYWKQEKAESNGRDRNYSGSDVTNRSTSPEYESYLTSVWMLTGPF